MGSKFGKQYPMFASRGEREKLLFVAAFGLALSLLIITLLVLNFRPEADARELASSTSPQPVIGTVSLLAPERPVQPGTRLADIKFKEVFWPRNQVPDEAIRDISEVQNQYAKVLLQPGFPIQRGNLTNEPMSISLPISPGMRAVAIDIDATSGLEGHALPGTKVDVVLTYHEEGNLTSKVIVPNARVVSFNGDTTQIGKRTSLERAAPQVGKTLTLEVSTSDALKIQTARQMGRISLIMRASDDDKLPATTEVDQNDVGSNKDEKAAKNNAARNCNRGKMKMQGKEYIIGCDNVIHELVESREP